MSRNSLLNKNLIPLFLIWIVFLITIFASLFTEVIFSTKNSIAFVLFLITTYLYAKNKKYYIYSFVLTCLAGLFDFLDVSYLNIIFSFFIFKVNPIYFLLIIVFLYTNKDLIEEKIK